MRALAAEAISFVKAFNEVSPDVGETAAVEANEVVENDAVFKVVELEDGAGPTG